MRSVVGRLAFLLLLAGILGPQRPVAWAQQAQRASGSEQQLAAEFSRLLEQWQKTDDPEVEIAAVESALRIEPQLGSWPLQGSREKVKGNLLSGLGDSYQKRRQGSRADNLEAAIKAFEKALTVRTREAFPQDRKSVV